MNNFQPQTAFILTFIATVIRFCDRVDFHRVDFVVSHLKGVMQNYIGVVLSVAQPNI